MSNWHHKSILLFVWPSVNGCHGFLSSLHAFFLEFLCPLEGCHAFFLVFLCPLEGCHAFFMDFVCLVLHYFMSLYYSPVIFILSHDSLISATKQPNVMGLSSLLLAACISPATYWLFQSQSHSFQ